MTIWKVYYTRIIKLFKIWRIVWYGEQETIDSAIGNWYCFLTKLAGISSAVPRLLGSSQPTNQYYRVSRRELQVGIRVFAGVSVWRVLVSKCCLKKHVEFIKYARQYIFKHPGEAEQLIRAKDEHVKANVHCFCFLLAQAYRSHMYVWEYSMCIQNIHGIMCPLKIPFRHYVKNLLNSKRS